MLVAQAKNHTQRRSLVWWCASVVAAVLCALACSAASRGESRVVFSCSASNDLFQAASNTFDDQVLRQPTPLDAIDAADRGDVLIVLAAEYPIRPTAVGRDELRTIRAKQLRCYIEFPRFLFGNGPVEPVGSHVERVVVVNDLFGEQLPRMSLLQVNGLHYARIAPQKRRELGEPMLVAARVAGFDSAVYGLPAQTAPLLLADESGEMLVATAGLSHFRRGRYSPYSSWILLWDALLQRLMRNEEPVALKYEPPVVSASYAADEPLPADCQRKAIERGIAWFAKSNMIIHPDWSERVSGTDGRVPPLPGGLPVGDGSLGSMEAVLSIIQADGHQVVSSVQRSDCICETAMAYAVTGKLLGDSRLEGMSRNLLDYLLRKSDATKQERGDSQHGAYGLVAWGITNPAWYKANYGDDNARVMLATMAAAGSLDESRWNETIARCVVGNLRTTGQLGFRGDRIDVEQLTAHGWKHYFRGSPTSYAPHFEGYLWACYLWAYSQTKDELLLDRARTALQLTMEQYPEGLRWTNGLAQERARILLPLAWLVRVDDSPANRAMLKQAIDGLLSIQDPCGAIREELGPPGRGMFPPPQSNEAYGVTEASLIARNGDPVADMLYTNNFALLGLHEAAAVSDDPRVREAEDRLAEFLIRIQARSAEVPEVDGGWMRAYDFERWEPWGSNADHGWGAWSIESGWTQGWITAVLAMREMETCLWDSMSHQNIAGVYPDIRERMLPQDFVDEVAASR